MREFLSYPEMGFFACAAILSGVAFATMQMLPFRYRTPVEIAGIILLTFMPAGDLRTLLLPLVFGGSYAHTLSQAIDDWRDSRKLCGGIVLGSVAAILLPEWQFAALLLFCTAANLPEISLKLAGVAVAAAMTAFIPHQPAPAAPHITPGSVMCALSWVKSNQIPRVIFIGSNEASMRASAAGIMPAAQVRFHGTLSGGNKNADLIIAPELPAVSDGGIKSFMHRLAPDGVLAVPVKYCGALPEISWLTLPGSEEKMAIGAKGRKLEFDPDAMDANLAEFFRGKESVAPLRGALAGMLTAEKVSTPGKLPWRNTRPLWITVMAATILLGGYVCFRNKKMANPEYFRIMLNCGGYALTAALFLPLLLDKIAFPGVSRLFIAVTATFFLRRPVANRSKFARSQGAVSVLAMLMALNGNVLWLLAALLCGGYACADLDNDIRATHKQIEPVRFFAIACGIAAAWGMTMLQLPLPAMILIPGAIRFYSWLRN